MKELKLDLLTNNHTTVFYQENGYNAPCNFIVAKSECEEGKPAEPLLEVHFQEGPVKECGVNGVMNEDLIAMVIKRLECFQESEFKCEENAEAIKKLQETLMWLRKRTMGREKRGVVGTHIK